MNLEDPNTWAQGANAFKAIFDGLRSAIGLLHDMRPSGGAREQQLVDEALEKASAATKIAEAQVAKALGYELCKCEFPPIPMRTVGYIDVPAIKREGPVYECPKCGYNSAGPWGYTRFAPPWKRPSEPEGERTD